MSLYQIPFNNSVLFNATNSWFVNFMERRGKKPNHSTYYTPIVFSDTLSLSLSIYIQYKLLCGNNLNHIEPFVEYQYSLKTKSQWLIWATRRGNRIGIQWLSFRITDIDYLADDFWHKIEYDLKVETTPYRHVDKLEYDIERIHGDRWSTYI